jgi:hypothetical protein
MDPVLAVQKQIDVSEADAHAALKHTNGDITEAILYLYNVPPPPVKPKTEWDERREICAAFEESMDAFVRRHSTVQPSATGAPIRVLPKPM